MRKITFILIFMLALGIRVFADNGLRISVLGGGLLPKISYQPSPDLDMKPIKFAHNIGRCFSASFELKIADNNFAGIIFQTQDLSWGIKALPLQTGTSVGVTSGANYVYNIYAVGATYNRVIISGKRLALEGGIALNAVFNFQNDYMDLTDTATENAALRKFSSGSNILYQLNAPTTKNTHLKFHVCSAVIGSYKFSHRFFCLSKVGYQFGFSNIIEQEINVTRMSQNKSQLFSIKLNGSGLFFQAGLGCFF